MIFLHKNSSTPLVKWALNLTTEVVSKVSFGCRHWINTIIPQTQPNSKILEQRDQVLHNVVCLGHSRCWNMINEKQELNELLAPPIPSRWLRG